MADKSLILDRHKREGSGPRRSQTMNDLGLGLAAIGHVPKGRDCKGMDYLHILRAFRSDLDHLESLDMGA